MSPVGHGAKCTHIAAVFYFILFSEVDFKIVTQFTQSPPLSIVLPKYFKFSVKHEKLLFSSSGANFVIRSGADSVTDSGRDF